MFDQVLKALGVLAGGTLTIAVIVAIAWAAFKLLAKRWLEHEFEQALARHQHALDRSLEVARSRLAAQVDRATRLQTKEFEVLPEAWALLAKAHGATARLLSPLQTYAQTVNVSPHTLEAALGAWEFTEEEKERIRQASSRHRQQDYQRLVDRYAHFAAHQEMLALNNYVILNGIFIAPDLRERLRTITGQIDDALFKYKHYKVEAPEDRVDWKLINDAAKEFRETMALRDEIHAEIGNRLWMPIDDSAAT